MANDYSTKPESEEFFKGLVARNLSKRNPYACYSGHSWAMKNGKDKEYEVCTNCGITKAS